MSSSEDETVEKVPVVPYGYTADILKYSRCPLLPTHFSSLSSFAASAAPTCNLESRDTLVQYIWPTSQTMVAGLVRLSLRSNPKGAHSLPAPEIYKVAPGERLRCGKTSIVWTGNLAATAAKASRRLRFWDRDNEPGFRELCGLAWLLLASTIGDG